MNPTTEETEARWYMKSPCKNCPYCRDVKPYLHPERGIELAYYAQNPYNSFSCHQTTEYSEATDDMECTEKTLECAGFMAMQHNESGMELPEGFKPAWDRVYGDVHDMVDAYENE